MNHPGSDSPSATARRRFVRILPLAFVTYSLAYLDRVNYGFGASAGLAVSLRITESTSALLSAAFFAGYFLFQIPGATLASRHGAKPLIGWALFVWGLLSSATGFITSIPWLMADRCLLGAVEGVVMPALLVWLGRWFCRSERSRANTLLILGNPVTLLWASMVSGYLIQAVGWQQMFVWEGLPSIVWAFAWWFWARESPGEVAWMAKSQTRALEERLTEEQAGLATPKNCWVALRDRRVLLLGWQFFCWSLGLYGFVLWLPKIVKDGLHHGMGTTGLLAALPYGVGVGLMLITSWLSDHFETRKIFVWPMLAGAAAAFAASYLIGPSHFAVAFCFLVLAGSAIFAGYGPFFAIIPDIIPRQAAGEAMALVNSCGALGGFVGTFVVGWLNGITGGPAAGFLFMALALAMASLCLALLPVRKTAAPIQTLEFGGPLCSDPR